MRCNDDSDYAVIFCELGPSGLAGDGYTWTCDDGWVDGEYTRVEGFTVTPGQAFWISAENDAQMVISSGEVTKKDIEVTLRFGNTLCGNPHPIAIDLQDITCNEESDYAVIFCELGPSGLAGDGYTWTNDDGWVDGEYTKVEGMTIEPGQGLWVSAENDTQKITFNAPDYE